MVQFYTEIPSSVIPWIQEQKMFWVATAPLSSSGHVNVSPKGYEGTFHIVNENRVWYEDLTGSGVETIAHLNENGRMTIMLLAFKGPPRIVRLFGTGTVHEFGSPKYDALIPMEKRHIGSRSAIVLDIHKVSTSCGYAVPFFDFKSHRTGLNKNSVLREMTDIKAEAESCAIYTSPSLSNTSAVSINFAAEIDIPYKVQSYPLAAEGLKGYWRDNNRKSIDGLPGVISGFKAPQSFSPNAIRAKAHTESGQIERIESLSFAQIGILKILSGLVQQEKYGMVVGFILGVLVMIIAERGMMIVRLAGIQWS